MLIAVGVLAFIPSDDRNYASAENDNTETEIEDYSGIAEPKLRIINLSEISLENQQTKYNLNDKVEIVSVLPSELTQDVIFIDSKWFEKSSENEANETISDLIKAGYPVVLIGNDRLYLEVNAPRTAFFDGGSVYCIYNDAKRDCVSCYTVINYDLENAIGRAYNWAVSSVELSAGAKPLANQTSVIKSGPFSEGISEKRPLAIQSNGAVLGGATPAYADIGCGSFGDAYVRTVYTEILSNNPTTSFYLVEYKIQSDSNGGSNRTTGLRVVDTISARTPSASLTDYGPTTSSGTTTVSIGGSVGVGMGLSGPSASSSFTFGWSYSAPDVIVIDDSNFGANRLQIFHQIDADSDAAMHSYLAKPGAVLESTKINGVSHFNGCVEYTAEFRTAHWYGYSQFVPYSCTAYVNI